MLSFPIFRLYLKYKLEIFFLGFPRDYIKIQFSIDYVSIFTLNGKNVNFLFQKKWYSTLFRIRRLNIRRRNIKKQFEYMFFDKF